MTKRKVAFISPQILFFLVLIGLCLLVFSLLQPAYSSHANLYAILLSATMPAMLALSMGVVISAGGFDLSIGHIAGFATLMCGYFLRSQGMDAKLAILIAVGLSIFIGLINGVLVAHFGISSFITTLSMQFVLVGVRQWITAGDSYRANSFIKSIAQSKIFGISNMIIITAIVLILVGFIIQKTSFGRKMQFVGSNIVGSAYCGINVKLYTFLSFVISGAIAGIVGILQFSKLTSATINIGDGWLFPAMTIAVFSSVIFERFKFQGIALVSILITMITIGINMLGVSSAWTNFVLGMILLLAMLGGKFINFESLFTRKVSEG
jgi:ribose transport system permease protein